MTRPIVDTLRHIHGGTLLDDASEKLAELVNSVASTGKAGSMTFTIDVRKASAGALALDGKVSVKLPKTEKVETLFFPTPEGNLLTEDPRQKKLDLTPVVVPSADALVVGASK